MTSLKLDWWRLFGRASLVIPTKTHTATQPAPIQTVSHSVSNTPSFAGNEGFHAWVDFMTDRGFLERDSENRVWIKHWDVATPRVFGVGVPNQPLRTFPDLFMLMTTMTDQGNPDVWSGKPGWAEAIFAQIPVIGGLMKGAQEFVDDRHIKYHLYRPEIAQRWQWPAGEDDKNKLVSELAAEAGMKPGFSTHGF